MAPQRAWRVVGAVGALGLAAWNLSPGLFTRGLGVGFVDGALMATGLGLIARQPGQWSGPLCLGLMIGKGLVLTLATMGFEISLRVPWAFSILILLYMAGTLAAARVWVLAGGALAAAILTWHGSLAWGMGVRAAWFVGLAGWLAPGTGIAPAGRHRPHADAAPLRGASSLLQHSSNRDTEERR
ncbi:hypothetical protein SAMN00768000_2189 [Sulfobacillus thermosulfidooxidans DSM 9293]|uniref:Uncharacterized protein n=1 Tax=Sulfobacillus thermosulfidooxidans (strain DSM 9293 / VKM B-1269 / AT-1) TaxID=929705 RepID=A0A1W1WGQ2_SULTA|nr:hypothetical protein [Sulfobacillus thermosulfidooxidans]SMC05359.1 hypothetical protein SAMN00768000_2189 [Sulfobacillus thermosulfidooxidans DSM 9293]